MPLRETKILKSQRGSALLNVLAVIFILLTIFFAVFAYALNRFSVLKKEINSTKAQYLSEGGLQRYLSCLGKDEIDLTQRNLPQYDIRISEDEGFQLSARLYGAYLLVTSIGKFKNTNDTSYALIGKLPGKNFNFAIINGSSEYPLTLAGRTKIIGDIQAGPGGVSKGEINGEYFQYETLNEGAIYGSLEKPAFALDREIIKKYINNIPNRADNYDRFIQGSLVLDNRSFENLEENSVILIENNLEINPDKPIIANRPITLIVEGSVEITGNARLAGSLEIISSGYINLREGARLDGALLVAEDSLIIGRGGNFSGQALSPGLITIKENARILHPSLIYSYYPGYSSDDRQIIFENNSNSQCIVVMDSTLDKTSERYNRISVDDYASITGILESEEYIELKGSLAGLVLTNQFIYRTDKSVYINWLRNASVDRLKLDFFPVMPINNLGINDYGFFKKYH